MSEPQESPAPLVAPAPGDDVLTAADLEPNLDPAKDRRRRKLDMVAAILAVWAVGLWIGGWVALGACAAPFVFQLPHPLGGSVMGAAFQRFDRIAIGCAIVALGCEVARALLSMAEAPQLAPRIRRYLTIVLAAAAVYSGVKLTPGIMSLHQEGVRRGVGPRGADLAHLHTQAELIAKGTVPGGLLIIVLHMLTLRSTRDEEDRER